MPGHEGVGEVVEVGSAVKHINKLVFHGYIVHATTVDTA
ncbi:hypothetical protein [Marinomonas primoryensis]